MTAVAAAKKLSSWACVTEVFCDVRSDSVRAMMVTLRLAPTPCANSTVPKNITSIKGAMKANSIAPMPLQSFRKLLAVRLGCIRKRDINSIAGLPTLVRFVLERHGRHQQALIARQVGDVVAEPRHEQRPLVENSDHHDVTRASGVVLHVVDEGVAVDLSVDRDVNERVVALHIHVDLVRVEQCWDQASEQALELTLLVARLQWAGLQLAVRQLLGLHAPGEHQA